MGGEKLSCISLLGELLESPPHGRGKVVLRQVAGAPAGITPAWAGKSPKDVSPAAGAQDHPRMGGEKAFCPPRPLFCRDHPRTGGEKFIIMSSKTDSTGSPPRGRGKEIDRLHKAINNRITPAWAGKRQRPATGRLWPWDHPRVGGEKSRVAPRSDPGTGSPPRRRGKDVPELEVKGLAGITPAWAGKSRIAFDWFGGCRDHPRVGGEKSA